MTLVLSILRPIYFFAARIFAQRAFCAAAILLRPAADILRRGLTSVFRETLPAVLAALIFAQRARAAAPILLLPAADIWRVGRAEVSPTAFCTRTASWPNSARTCCNRAISARTSLAIFSMLNVFSVSRDATRKNSTTAFSAGWWVQFEF
jgi:hypothetical protein